MEPEATIKRKVARNVEYYIKSAFKVFFFILFIILVTLLVGYIVMWLWNWLMPELFGLKTLTYWQAVGLLFLAKIFFGFGSGGPGKGNGKRKFRKKFSKEKCGGLRRDFDDWKLYDRFWKEEGENAFKNYVHKIKGDEEDEKTS